jgi:hypothetical protein
LKVPGLISETPLGMVIDLNFAWWSTNMTIVVDCPKPKTGKKTILYDTVYNV